MNLEGSELMAWQEREKGEEEVEIWKYTALKYGVPQNHMHTNSRTRLRRL